MKITAVTATALYAPRWLPYTDENGVAFAGGEGRAGSDGRPADQNSRRGQKAGQESRGGVVVIETDGPHVGLGEVSTCWSPDGVEQCRCVTERLAALVVGTVNPAASINSLVDAMDAACGMDWGPAKAAVEMALLDLAGKQLGVPVCTLLGGQLRERIPLSHSIGQAEPERMAALALEKSQEGYQTIKLKVGEAIEKDIERCAAVRAAIGPGPTMRVDANGAWYRSMPPTSRTSRSL
jgi:muconate cycloisomerase